MRISRRSLLGLISSGNSSEILPLIFRSFTSSSSVSRTLLHDSPNGTRTNLLSISKSNFFFPDFDKVKDFPCNVYIIYFSITIEATVASSSTLLHGIKWSPNSQRTSCRHFHCCKLKVILILEKFSQGPCGPFESLQFSK